MTAQNTRAAAFAQLNKRKPGSIEHFPASFDDTRFGFKGIQSRFRDKPGRLIRAIDPFSCELVEFSTPLQYENWLLRRFDPRVIYLDPSRDEWDVLHHGQQLEVKPHLHWAGWSDKGFLELVAEPGRDVSNAMLDTLEIVARAHGLTPVIRVAADIRSQPKLLDFLDRTRQMLMMHIYEMRDAAVRKSVFSYVSGQPQVTRGEVLAVCAEQGTTELAVDCVLFWLRQTGALHFDVTGGRYDDRTLICAA